MSLRGGALLLGAALAAGCGEGTQTPLAPEPAARSSAPARAWFRDATEASGLAFVHEAGFSADKHLPETMGAGAALIDADGDGVLDVYFVQGGAFPPGGAAAAANRLFLGQGGGRFRDASAHSEAAAHRGYGMGVAAGDVNGDGNVDLFVSNFGPDALFAGKGDGSFRDATAEAGLADERWTAGAAFFDADLDGDLDLYVTAYVAIDVTNPEWCGDHAPGWRSYCHPDHYAGLPDRFWRNDGDGIFTDATAQAGLADNAGKGLGAIPFDPDNDGDLDLYVANDSVENRFWRNDGTGHFADDTLLTGTGVNRNGATEAGMGLAVGDADGDGDFDLLVTNFDDESNTLYRNDGDGLFVDATIAFGLEAPSRLPVGFGAVFEDFDLDGDLDLAVANGHIIDNIHLYHDGKTWRQVAQLFVNDKARLRNSPEFAGALAAEARLGRGLYAGDLDGDGDPDLLLTQCGEAAVLLENIVAGGGARVVRGLAPGTRVEARTPDGQVLLRQLGCAVSYFGVSESAVFLPPMVESVRVREPGGLWRPLE